MYGVPSLLTRLRRSKSCRIYRICGADSPSKHADFFDGNGDNIVTVPET